MNAKTTKSGKSVKKVKAQYARAVPEVVPLNETEIAFVEALLADPARNQTRAAQAAGVTVKHPANWAYARLKDPRIREMIQARQAGVRSKWEGKPDEIVADCVQVMLADPREISEVIVTCCRFCHGYGFRYQSTPAEYRDRLARYLADHLTDDPYGTLFPMEGGADYDARLPPRPDCPECHGFGLPRVVLHDTRFLSIEARALYVGAKQGMHGVEVRTRDKDAARKLLALHTGVLPSSKNVNHTHTGPNGGPIPHAVVALSLTTTDPQEAARQYMQLMGA